MAEKKSSREPAAARREGVRGAPRHDLSWLRTGRGWLAGRSDAVVSVIFPAGCRICDRLLTGASRVASCEECLTSFVRVPKTACEVCGRPLETLTHTEAGEPL